MNFRFLFLLVVGLALGMNPALGQIEQAVTWDISFEPQGDQTVELVFEARIAPGYHIYSAVAPEGMPALSTALAFDNPEDEFQLKGPLQEEGDKEVYYDDIFELELGIFHQQAVFRQTVKLASGVTEMSGEVLYQTCDDSRCIPGSLPFSFSLSD